MNDGKFSAGLINESTQIVIMDEWTPDCLGCDDAKRILQGKLLLKNNDHNNNNNAKIN